MVDVVNPMLYQTSQFPYDDWWVENPFISEPIIKNRTAGYRPLQTYKVTTIGRERECPSTFQTPCDIIVPRNLCYRKYREIIIAP
jgi:hypothetical protein